MNDPSVNVKEKYKYEFVIVSSNEFHAFSFLQASDWWIMKRELLDSTPISPTMPTIKINQLDDSESRQMTEEYSVIEVL
jgi:hypothetical protein